MKNKPVIVLTGGGSGGHITPLLSLGHALRKIEPECKIVYIGLKGDKLAGLQTRYQVFDEVYFITAGKFRRYHGQSLVAHLADIKTLLLNARDIFRVIAGTFQARKILKKVRPGVVFSKGGYVAVPVGIAAHRQKIPLVTHDSDATAGLANRLIGRWARVHATGLDTDSYPYPKTSIKYVGIPVDERLQPVTKLMQQRYKKALGLPASSVVLLVGGAGLGSLSMNNKTVAISDHLLADNPNLHILHITGSMHESAVAAKYRQKLSPEQVRRVNVVGFTPEFYLFTGAADLVVTRAGATTLAELAIQKKPALLIPAPFLTGGQQLKNAESLKKVGAAAVVDDKCDTNDLYSAISELLRDQRKRTELATKIGQLAKPQAATDLAKLILEAAQP